MTKTSAKRGRKSGAGNDGALLDDYRRKRDPAQTNEPFAAERIGSAGKTVTGAFVVHLHDATRRHYDLRLEVSGVLKSFAVPKGPSLNPIDKRLAVNTEDHPIEYLDFEDVIPEGNYGAGAMIVWDAGRVHYLEGSAEEGIGRGKIDFVLDGQKVHGRFALVQTGKRQGRSAAEANQWLLIKKEDAYASAEKDILEEARSILSGLTVEELARKAEVAAELEARAARLGAPEQLVDARRLVPMLCATTDVPLKEKGRYYELKLDGVRIIAEKDHQEIALRYRTHRSATAAYPEVARAMRALAPERVILDGEVLAFDAQGRPSFHRLARRIHARRPHDVALAAAEIPVIYVVFDVLQIGKRNLMGLPLSKRKEILSELVPGRGFIRTLDHIEDDGSVLYDFCKERRLEGVVAKRADSPYRPGPNRTDDWVKVKCERIDDFVITAWVAGKGGRQRLGAVEVSSYSGSRLVLRGRVGSGLDESTIAIVLNALRPLEVEQPTAEGEPARETGERHFVRPRVVVSVQYSGWTDDGHLRHPVFHGVRPDQQASECTAAPPEDGLDEASASEESENATEEGAEEDRHVADGPETATSAMAAAKSRPLRFKVSNRDKIFWPDEGYTKGDLVDYYVAISEVMLRYLADRPIVLVRYPDGIRGKSFYQWNVPVGTPAWLRTLRLIDEEGNEEKHTFIVDDADGLAYVANLGCIPIHILGSRAGSPDYCDFLTIDFDLGDRPFRDAVILALSLRELLEDIGLEGFPKTSGHSGLHVLIPMGPGVSFDVAKTLLELIGRLLQVKHADIATMERRISKRGDRVYIDTGQTGRSRTIVAPYSVRAVPGATVSMPIAWDEVHLALEPHQFTMFSAVERVSKRGDPMQGLLRARPDIADAVTRLERKITSRS